MPRLIVLGIAMLVAAVAHADLVATFEAGNEGWSVVAYPFRSHVAAPDMTPAPFDDAFGTPPGSLRIGDVYGETGAAAPAAWLGDQSACYGQTLSYDLYLRYVDVGATYPAVVLNGGTLSLYYDLAAPATNTWTALAIPLTEAGWRLSGSFTPVDEATFRSVLADLHGLYIYTEWHTGADDTNLDNVRLAGAIIGVDDALPAAVTLQPGAPNPFNPSTTLRFALAAPGPARLEILGLDGRRVRVLLDEVRPAGAQAVTWDGRDDAGRPLASGAYICRLSAAGEVRATRLTLAK